MQRRDSDRCQALSSSQFLIGTSRPLNAYLGFVSVSQLADPSPRVSPCFRGAAGDELFLHR
jgi:hypothetical protein